MNKSPATKSSVVAVAVTQAVGADGSTVLKPTCVLDDRDVKIKEAADFLGLKRDAIYTFCEIGEPEGLKVWTMPSKKGNAAWRISWQSVRSLKERLSPR